MSENKSIESMMQELRVVDPPDWITERAYIKSMEEYEVMYKRSVEDPEGFWAEQAENMLYWHKKWDTVLDYEFDTGRRYPRPNWWYGGPIEAFERAIFYGEEAFRLNPMSGDTAFTA